MVDPNQSNGKQNNAERLSESEFLSFINEHKKWLSSNGKDGERAVLVDKVLEGFATGDKCNLSRGDFRHSVFKDVNFSGWNFCEADLEGADLKSAALKYADFKGANLIGADFKGADLRDVELSGARLKDANLESVDLSGANLRGLDLSRANLRHSVLNKADLYEANLEGADLRRAELEGAQMYGCVLTDANLRDANLRHVKLRQTPKNRLPSYPVGLSSPMFGGADLTRVELPEDIAKFDGLSHVKEISGNARKIFFGVIAACAYSWITVATTTDAQLIANSVTTPLPIISTKIPIAAFYWIAPLVLLSIYLYFHFYLLRLWQVLGTLPAVFPDGKRLDEKAYPWLLVGLVRAHKFRLKGNCPPLSRPENWITIFLAWRLVPITVAFIWLRYLPRHDFWILFHILVLTISVWIGVVSYRLLDRMLSPGIDEEEQKGELHRPYTFEKIRLRYEKFRFVSVWPLGLGAVAGILTYLAIVPGTPFRGDRKDIRTWAPAAFEAVGFSVFADLTEEVVSSKPDNFRSVKKDIDLVTGARLPGRDLRYAVGFRAFLVKADFRFANLENAEFHFAMLQGARFFRANLTRASLQGAKLNGATLESATLDHADLQNADLEDASLFNASLREVDLRNANLKRAILNQADLTNATVWGANFVKASFYKANLTGVNFGRADLRSS